MIATEHAQFVVMKSGRPVGVLSVDADMIPEELASAKQAFLKGVRDDGIAALVKASFAPVGWNPDDLALIPAREFNMRLSSQITGVPPYLLGVASGDSKTYSNMETEWSNFLRVSVQQYLNALEAPFARCLPRGSDVRFSSDELRRPEVKTRWEAWAIAHSLGAMTIPEIRQAERLPPQPTGDLREDSDDA
jgi:HK97 family phage portal protein